MTRRGILLFIFSHHSVVFYITTVKNGNLINILIKTPKTKSTGTVIGAKQSKILTFSIRRLMGEMASSMRRRYRTAQQAKHIKSCSLSQPITFKVVITCMRACPRLLLCFWRLIRRFSISFEGILVRILPLAILFSKIVIFLINWY